MDKVSVIIPTHNSSRYLDECIISVLNQTYTNLEIIVIDDKSEDDTIQRVKKYKDKRIKLIELDQHEYVSVARNRGIDESTGKYLCFLDSDDYWAVDKVEKQIKFMKENDYTFIFSDYAYLKNDEPTRVVKCPTSITYEQALKNTTIFTSTVMFDMTKINKEDIHMPHLRRGQDTATWWQVLKKGITAYSIPEVLAYYRVGKESLSSNKLSALKRTWNLYKREDISYIKKVYCFMCYIFNAIKRRIG